MTPNFQAVKDVAAGHEALIHIFWRIHLFLQRLNRYTGMPLTGDMTELLGKIMSQVLSILALSTKEMDRRISELDCPVMPFFHGWLWRREDSEEAGWEDRC